MLASSYLELKTRKLLHPKRLSFHVYSPLACIYMAAFNGTIIVTLATLKAR